jgi:hypothetical protein
VQMGGAHRTFSSLRYHRVDQIRKEFNSCLERALPFSVGEYHGYGTVSPAIRALFTTNSNCDKADTADQCDHAQSWRNRHSFLLFMADLNGARVDVFLFVCEGESSECEADNTDEDENYSYDGGGFHVFLSG